MEIIKNYRKKANFSLHSKKAWHTGHRQLNGLPDWDDSYNIVKYGKFGHERSEDVREEPSQFSSVCTIFDVANRIILTMMRMLLKQMHTIMRYIKWYDYNNDTSNKEIRYEQGNYWYYNRNNRNRVSIGLQ